MTTVQGLINYLNTIEDKDQPIVFQFYLAEHFEIDKDTFGKVSTELDGVIPENEDNWETIRQVIKEITNE